MKSAVTFDNERGPDGRVRAGVWDRVCVPGVDEKEGQHTEFSLETLSQMVDNFVDRGDLIPIDHNHQSNYAAQNGMPAPALGWYGGLAVVWGGKVVKQGYASGVVGDVNLPGLNPLQNDLSRDGLWCLRTEVTELGNELLPNFKLLSPTFTPEGTKRDGTPCGYCLMAVAATNTPWQAGTEITFEQFSAGAAGTTQEGAPMKKSAKLAAFMTSKYGTKFEADADDKKVAEMAKECMEGEAAEAMGAEKYDYGAGASALEEMAKLYEDAHFEDAQDGDEAPHSTMRRMAAKFRKMGEPPAVMESPKEKDAKDDAKDAKMTAMEASLNATRAQLAKLEASESARAQAAEREREHSYEQLADAAIAGGYPKEARGALIKFARTDVEGARASVAHLLPKTGAPGHIFDRLSSQGAPVGKGGDARSEYTPKKPRRVQAMGRTFIEDDSEFADEIKRVAASEDPATKAKVDKLIPVSRRASTFDRLMAADRVVRAERPELAEEAE